MCTSVDVDVGQKDRDAFFRDIDSPLALICGGCGALSNPKQMKMRTWSHDEKFFEPLWYDDHATGVKQNGIIDAAIVEKVDANGVRHCAVPLCTSCMTALQHKRVPKFSKASGFKLCDIPPELAELNPMETKMIGLGVCFTTCFQVSGGQHFTTGNSINYFNDSFDVVRKLPRPLTRAGVIRLKASGEDQRTSYYNVRPQLLKKALIWLREHNPLYRDVEIDEEVLQELSVQCVDTELPSIEVDAVPCQVTNRHDTERESDEHSDTSERNDTVNTRKSTTATNGNVTGQTGYSVLRDDLPGICELYDLEEWSEEGQTEVGRILESLRQPTEKEVADRSVQEEHLHELDTDRPCSDLPRPKKAMNEYETKMMMQMCFPTLFPDGFGGIHPLENETRIHEYTLADYCSHLMKWHDRRFVMHRNFKFFCVNLIQRRQIDGIVRQVPDRRHFIGRRKDGETIHEEINIDDLRKVHDEKELSDAGRQLLKQLKPYFKAVRGSGLYWSNVRDDLMAMIGNDVLPTRWPTFFFTLSAADTIWPDFFRACDPTLTHDEASNLSARDRERYLVENPDIASRHFQRRFNSFFEHVLQGQEQPLGEITDHFWRIEFQKRGSPHVHGLLWVKDAPDVLALSETDEGREELAKFVDKYISASTMTNEELAVCDCARCVAKADTTSTRDILTERPPNASLTTKESMCDVSRIVQRVQQHVCYDGSSCRQKSGVCRFDFPKVLREHTTIERTTTSKGTPIVRIEPRRNHEATNNYCPKLLRVWRANMDIKLIGNAYGAAEYTAAYCSKAEPDTSRFRHAIAKALGRCDANLPYCGLLKKIANASLSIREVSAQEAFYILHRDMPMYSKSRNIIRIKAMRHEKRFYRVDLEHAKSKNDDESTESTTLSRTTTSTNEMPSLHELDTDTEQPEEQMEIKLEPLERAYMARPEEEPFASMTYRTFTQGYELSRDGPKPRQRLRRWKRTDGNAYIKEREKLQAVTTTPKLRPDDQNADFCFAEIFMDVPWRDLRELPATDEECIATFARLRSEGNNTVFTERTDALCERQRCLDDVSSVERSREPLPTPDWAMHDEASKCDDFETMRPMTEENDSNTSVETETNNTRGTFKPKRPYTMADIARAEAFVVNEIRPYLEEKKKKKCSASSNDVESAVNDMTPRSNYRYPIDQREVMNDDQWVPFALCMTQARKRYRAMVEGTDCAPMRMILSGEGGSGKS